MMNEELVKCTGLCRSFEAVQALRGVDLSLTSGKIVGLLGPNGSGKTTLIKILNGLLQPTAGEARVAGLLPGVETKAITSYLPDRGYFPDWMRVGDMIDMFSDFYADFDRAKAEEMCRVLGLEAGRRIKTLSKGTREKMQLMLVMSRRARLYLLDEPIAGVDPAAREFILRTILTNYNENGTVLISTHLILDVEQVLDEAVFLQQGQVVLHESTDSIRERTGGSVDELFRNMFRAPVMGNGGEYNARQTDEIRSALGYPHVFADLDRPGAARRDQRPYDPLRARG